MNYLISSSFAANLGLFIICVYPLENEEYEGEANTKLAGQNIYSGLGLIIFYKSHVNLPFFGWIWGRVFWKYFAGVHKIMNGPWSPYFIVKYFNLLYCNKNFFHFSLYFYFQNPKKCMKVEKNAWKCAGKKSRGGFFNFSRNLDDANNMCKYTYCDIM